MHKLCSHISVSTLTLATFTCLIVSPAHAQQSALMTSGMGGGASSTARLTAVQTQQINRLDDIETCGNKARLFGPAFGGAKDGDNCLTGITLTSGGNFGIGTSSPSQRLDTGSGNAKISTLRVGDVGHGTGWPGIGNDAVADTSGNYAIIQNASGQTFINGAAGQFLGFRLGNADKMRLTAAGDVGIGTTAPGAKLHVAGTLRSNGALTVAGGGAAITGNSSFSNNVAVSGSVTAQSYYHSSDKALKENIRPLEEGESIVTQLKPVRFIWKNNAQSSMGFVAQDIEEVLPEAVTTDPRGFKAVDYDLLAAPIIATLQALQAQVAGQQQEIHRLQVALKTQQQKGR